MRVVLFFAYFLILVIGMPMLLAGIVQHVYGLLDKPAGELTWAVKDGRFVHAQRLLASGGQPTVDLRPQLPYAAAAAMTYVDGVSTMAVLAGSADDAARAMRELAQRFGVALPADAVQGRFGPTNFSHAQVLRRDERLLLLVGSDPAALDRQLAALPGLDDVSVHGNRFAPDWMRRAAFGLLVLWVGLHAVLFGRVASWAGQVPALPGVAAVSAQELGGRLLALNRLDLPYEIKRGTAPNEYIVDWRYADAKWMDLARLHGMTRSYRLVLRLDDEAHNVRAQDRYASMDWSAGFLQAAASLDWKVEWGITFWHYRHERVYGLQFRDGRPTVDLEYRYTFDLQELKQPIIEMTRHAGWNYRPVISFFRLIGG